MGAVENSAFGSDVVGVAAVTGTGAAVVVFRTDTHSEGRRLYRSILQFRQTIRPVKEFRRLFSSARSVEPMRSANMKRVGALNSRESRICVPILEFARESMGSGAGVDGVRRVAISFRRNVRLLGVGKRAAWRICDVGVKSERVWSVAGDCARIEACMRSVGAPGMASMDWERSEPWSCAGAGLGICGGRTTVPSSSCLAGGGRTVAVKAGRSDMHANFNIKSLGSDPYAAEMASVNCAVGAPRAWHRSIRILTITVRFRSINPVICGSIAVTASSRSSLERRAKTLVTTYEAISLRARPAIRSLKCAR